MIKKINKNETRVKRHVRLRHDLAGTTARPRLCVYRSLNHIYAQIIDDVNGTTLVAASSVDMKLANGGNIEAAKAVGAEIAKRAEKANIKKVVFDRGGYLYHGKVKALADGARSKGLEF